MPFRSARNVLSSTLVLFALALGLPQCSFAQSSPAVDPVPPLSTSSVNSSNAVPPVAAPSSSPSRNFFSRFFKAYADDWRQLPSSESAPAFRGAPSPVDGPPFPFSDWPYGGSAVLGKPWTQSSPLMQAIWSGPHGDAWKNSGVQIYGWANVGFNVSTSAKSGYANLPAAYADRPNTVEADQEVLYV